MSNYCKSNIIKRKISKIINIRDNEKLKSSKCYELCAKKHNLKTMSDSVIAIRELSIHSKKELDHYI